MFALWKARFRAFVRCAKDDSGNALVDYALVMTVLTLGMMVAVDYVGTAATTHAADNQTRMTTYQTKAAATAAP